MILIAAVAFITSSFAAHKFYVAIFQVNYAAEKKMLQVTSRIFVDDLNEAFKLKHKRTFAFENEQVSADDRTLLQKYFNEEFIISINDRKHRLNLISFEMESNVLICYLSIKDVPKVRSLQITNTILTNYVTEQQNIIQTNVYGNKKNLLLTVDNPSGKINF